jgi:predicted MFS family arabinose efflux permease
MVGAYPAMTLAQIFPIERVASGIITLWGICLILTPVCFNYQTLYVQRFFLGMLEAGVSPMFMLIVVSMIPDISYLHGSRTHTTQGGWYKKNEQAFRMG